MGPFRPTHSVDVQAVVSWFVESADEVQVHFAVGRHIVVRGQRWGTGQPVLLPPGGVAAVVDGFLSLVFRVDIVFTRVGRYIRKWDSEVVVYEESEPVLQDEDDFLVFGVGSLVP